MTVQPAHIARIIDHIHDCLRAHPDGLSEHALLSRLRAAGLPGLQRPQPHDMLGLFRQHFLLMHCLYRLQARLNQDADTDLAISPLCIVLRPWTPTPADKGLSRPDPLKAYYLDLRHLQDTGADEVAELLQDFRRRYEGTQQRAAALDELGLQDPVDARAIKRRYRELAMQHHPDRGGDGTRLQRLNEAMRRLEAAGTV